MSSSAKILTSALRQIDRSLTRSAKQRRRASISLANQHRMEGVKSYKLQQHQQVIASAAAAVRQYEDYVHSLVSLHHHAGPLIDWPGMLAEPAPPPPIRSSAQEGEAVALLAAYTP